MGNRKFDGNEVETRLWKTTRAAKIREVFDFFLETVRRMN